MEYSEKDSVASLVQQALILLEDAESYDLHALGASGADAASIEIPIDFDVHHHVRRNTCLGVIVKIATRVNWRKTSLRRVVSGRRGPCRLPNRLKGGPVSGAPTTRPFHRLFRARRARGLVCVCSRGSHAWLKRGPCARSREDEVIMPAVRASFVARSPVHGGPAQPQMDCRLHLATTEVSYGDGVSRTVAG